MGTEFLSDFEIMAVHPSTMQEALIEAIKEISNGDYEFMGPYLQGVTFYDASDVFKEAATQLGTKFEVLRIGQDHERFMYFAAPNYVSKVEAVITYPIPTAYTNVAISEPPVLSIETGAWRIYVEDNGATTLAFFKDKDLHRYSEDRFLSDEADTSRFQSQRHGLKVYETSQAMFVRYNVICRKLGLQTPS